jgi:hypothetical protein
MAEISERMLTIEAAAALIGVEPAFLINCNRHKSGPTHYKYSQKTVLYPKAELLAWAESCQGCSTLYTTDRRG